ncbi:BnaA09g46810D [Brassica napus]|uniref:V-type proton ATPase subunit C n=1 Tax=Brassica napus TaxID=3708 RepID=A0A078GMR2_BRANA|nr:BnaA09g46810D [Brassica napus]
MTSRYWVVSLPVKDSSSTLWNRLQEQISKHSFDTPVYRFNIPNLRVGTLDSLLALGDDLLKSNSFVEGVSQKIRRQIEELERISGVESNALTVDGVPVDSYLTRFVWDEAKYPTMSPLKEVVENIQSQVAKIEDDLKVRVAEYNNVRGQLNAINRKQSGSLAVRDLSSLVKPEDIVASEHLETLLAVVPKYSQKDWLACYETLTDFVVPRSSKKLFEDNEYALYTVTLFTRVADNFRTNAREKGFQVRDFEHSVEAQETRKQELEKLVQDQESLRSSLLQWCYTSYGEVFSSWMHFCAVRIFAESIMRYGLPPAFLACVLSPAVKSEKKVRSILERLCDSTNSLYWKSEEDAGAGGAMAGLAGDSETHPYVSFTINLDSDEFLKLVEEERGYTVVKTFCHVVTWMPFMDQALLPSCIIFSPGWLHVLNEGHFFFFESKEEKGQLREFRGRDNRTSQGTDTIQCISGFWSSSQRRLLVGINTNDLCCCYGSRPKRSARCSGNEKESVEVHKCKRICRYYLTRSNQRLALLTEKQWSCPDPQRGKIYHREQMENRLVQIVRQSEKMYQIQDLLCIRCNQVKAAHLTEQCECAGSFRCKESGSDFLKRMEVFLDIIS